jgi:hypothetical protein
MKIAQVLDYRDAPSQQQRVHRALGVIRVVDVERVDAGEGGAGVAQELGGGACQEGALAVPRRLAIPMPGAFSTAAASRRCRGYTCSSAVAVHAARSC